MRVYHFFLSVILFRPLYKGFLYITDILIFIMREQTLEIFSFFQYQYQVFQLKDRHIFILSRWVVPEVRFVACIEYEEKRYCVESSHITDTAFYFSSKVYDNHVDIFTLLCTIRTADRKVAFYTVTFDAKKMTTLSWAYNMHFDLMQNMTNDPQDIANIFRQFLQDTDIIKQPDFFFF